MEPKFIGQSYEVLSVLGQGGFGIVYEVYSQDTGGFYALKSVKEEYKGDSERKELFRKEASVWIALDRHPHIVRAFWVDEIGGLLCIVMEFVHPNESGLSSLGDYLRERPPDLAQSLRWAIQFCYGMEHAYSKGLRCHRDIKPTNILIEGQDGMLKISDFGLAGALKGRDGWSGTGRAASLNSGGHPATTLHGGAKGTVTHMSPEQFFDAASCDERSDIYSFGVVMYQMATGGLLPFLAALPRGDSIEEQIRFILAMRELHCNARVPKLRSPLFPAILRCMAKRPIERFPTFSELRADLGRALYRETGERVSLPPPKKLEATEWDNKGISFNALGRLEDALSCHDRALALNPRSAGAWSNKGITLLMMNRLAESTECIDRALQINPLFALAWTNKSAAQHDLGQLASALECANRALEIDPTLVAAWRNKALVLSDFGQHQEALQCLDRASQIRPPDADFWNSKATVLKELGQVGDAIICLDRSIELNPRHRLAWSNRAKYLCRLRRFAEALDSFDRAVEIEPNQAWMWENRAVCLHQLGRHCEAVESYEKALQIDNRLAHAWANRAVCLIELDLNEPALHSAEMALKYDQGFAIAWWCKGVALHRRHSYDDAIAAYDQALRIDPAYASAWIDKGCSLNFLDRYKEAVACLDRGLELNPSQPVAWFNKGAAFHHTSRLREAIECYEHALQLSPRYSDVWWNKALAEDKLGMPIAATRSYQEFIAINSSQPSDKTVRATERLRELTDAT